MKNINLFTHGGIFHADEVFASVVLCSVFEKNYSEIKRVFCVPDDISDSDIVYDIGGGKFDHHQREGNGVRDNGIPYASAGLIWKRYGEYFLILQAADLSKNFWNPNWNTENIKKLWKTVGQPTRLLNNRA